MNTPGALARWTPGLDDALTLRAAYDSMPGDDAAAIPWYVRLLENPASPVALPGAIDLFGHDCVHILLGRGTLSEDEAFVLGVTMGAGGRLRTWQQSAYSACARHLYRGVFRFSRIDRLVFDTAVEFARHSGMRPLTEAPWRDLLDRPLGETRAALGVDARQLIAVYESERVLWPRSDAARRLPRGVAAGRPA